MAATAAPSATCSASAASSAACSLPGESPPSSAAISPAPIRAAASTPRAAHELDRGRARRDRGAAARRLEAGGGDALAVERQVDAHEVAADGTAGGAAERRRGHVAAPPGIVQMLSEGLGVHRRRV